MGKSNKVTKEMFECAKILFNGGASNREVERYLNLSDWTVCRIKRSENYEEYLQGVYAKSAAYRAKKAAEQAAKKAAEDVKPAEEKAAQVVEHRQSISIQATHYMETKLDQVIEQMKLINAKLGAIIDDLYGTGKKAGA